MGRSTACLVLSAALGLACASRGSPAGAPTNATPLAPGLRALDATTLAADRDLWAGPAARNRDGSVNALVEIPAGTLAKWEVKGDGRMHWDVEDGRPRVVRYLPYPVNYGIIPRAVLSKRRGGDGDPLDVLVLGPATARGALVPVRVIGVMRMIDRGEIDDKLLAVAAGSPFADVQDAEQLEREFPGVREIVTTWFSHYKGPGRTRARGFDGREPALALLEQALADYAAERTSSR